MDSGKIGHVHYVVVQNYKLPNAHSNQLLANGRARASCSDHTYAETRQQLLAIAPERSYLSVQGGQRIGALANCCFKHSKSLPNNPGLRHLHALSRFSVVTPT